MRWLDRLFAFILGVIVASIAPDVLELEFDYKYNVADVFGLFVTLTVAYVITVHFSRKNTERRAEKELVISFIKDLLKKSSRLNELLSEIEEGSGTPANPQALVKRFKQLSSDLQHIEECMKEYQLIIGDSTVGSISHALTQYKQAVTLNQTIDFNLASIAYAQVRSDLFHLLREINRC
jgi:hypothetical protein